MYHQMMRWLFVGCLMSFGFLHAAWSPPDDLSVAGQSSSVPQVAVDGNGNATAVWMRFNGADNIIQASTKPFDGAWQAVPDDLSVDGQNAVDSQVAVDPNGNATAVWSRSNGTNNIIQASTKPFGGIWHAPEDLSVEGQDASYPQIAVDTSGNATVVWMRSNGTNTIIQTSTKPFGGIWHAPEDLSVEGQDASYPQIAVDTSGNATAVWAESNGINNIIQASTKPFGGIWQAPEDLSAEGQDAFQPQIAVDPSGNATAVWAEFNGTKNIIQASTKPFGGTWQAPEDLSAEGQDASYPQIAVDPSGNATAVWARFNGTNYIIQASTKPFGGIWQAPEDLSAEGQDAILPQIAVDANGNATVVWMRSNGTDNIIQASTKPFGGVWQAPENLSADGQNAILPQIAVDANGNATVVWMRSNGTDTIIQASTHFFGPTVTRLNPNSGPSAGGTSVTITGTDFLEGSSVMFGSTPAVSVIVNSLTTITAVAPHGTGTVNVTVTVQGMTSPITAADQYTYQSQPARFRGKVQRREHKLFIKATWKKSTTNTIARYEIFARHKRIKKISAHKKPQAIIHLHPHSVPHHISKKYRHYLHKKYKIRSIDISGIPSSFTQLKIRH
jgi:hypothetical protein